MLGSKSMAKKPIISVIVPAYNEQHLISKCIESLLDQNIDESKYEIIVVDNASTDKTNKIAKNYPVRVIREKVKGYVFALLKGAKVARGQILSFTDADCRVNRDWIRKILLKFENNPHLDALGGTFAYFDAGLLLTQVFRLYQKTINSTWGGNMSIKKSAYEKVGGFKNKVNLCTDFDLFLRLKSQKFNIEIDRSLTIKTSARRYKQDLLRSLLTYSLNSIWLENFKKPIIYNFSDIREDINSKNNFPGFALKLSLAFVIAIFVLNVYFPSFAHSKTLSIYNEIKDSRLAKKIKVATSRIPKIQVKITKPISP